VGWSKLPLADIPSTAEAGYWQEWAREPDFGGRWHSVGEVMDVKGFGVNVGEADAGRELIVPHDEVAYGGQEELYVVLRGGALFTCDGEQVELAPGEMLLVSPDVRREATAMEDDTAVLCIGGTPGKAYSRD
jgi:mannose-6-phosphate isomerase-like protein (cupin superfamily)